MSFVVLTALTVVYLFIAGLTAGLAGSFMMVDGSASRISPGIVAIFACLAGMFWPLLLLFVFSSMVRSELNGGPGA